MPKFIPIYEPWLGEEERKNLIEAYDSTWISSNGHFVDSAEERLANLLGVEHAISCSNGTNALYLCLAAMDIGPQDIVAIPTTTFAATAFAVSYVGSTIILIDADPHTWNMDLNQLERALSEYRITVVIPVHLFGNPVDMDKLYELQSKYDFKIVEDACESLMAEHDGKKTGSFGTANCFSFYGNKTVTCGEGGIVATDDDEVARMAKLLRGQAQRPGKRYWHDHIGHNFRLTNLQAAVLCGQLDRLDEIHRRKIKNAELYREYLKDEPSIRFQVVPDKGSHSWWVVTITTPMPRRELEGYLRACDIDSRPVFYPMHILPPYENCHLYNDGGYDEFDSVGEYLSEYGITLPSSPLLTPEQVKFICDSLKEILNAPSPR
jgi:perosamine synthetase